MDGLNQVFSPDQLIAMTRRTIEPVQKERMICPRCMGDGLVGDGSHTKCYTCKGKALVYVMPIPDDEL